MAPEASELLAREDDRLPSCGNERGRLGERLLEGGLVARVRLHAGGDDLDRGVDEVAWQLEVDRPAQAEACGERPVDDSLGALGVGDDGRRARDLAEHHELAFEAADLVVEQRVMDALPHPRATADHDHGGPLGVRLGRRVDDLEPADAVRDAHRADAVRARVAVGSEAGALLVGAC